ncbi:hypothetical protein [Cutibacterium acnes]|uniref:hypothetical protein n=1 Tax=Cutibacterium acnes TaxID=1747 RepID=UPI002236C95D|nr:hypothetical protein [Cutibacterium acnes 18B]
MSVWGPLEFGRGWQRIRTAVEAAMKADYTDQVVRPALGEWVDESMATTRGSSVLLLFIFSLSKNNFYDEAVFVITLVS